MKPTIRWGVLAFLLAPFGSWALELGDIGLVSARNQPLDAKIELVSVTEDELTTLSVKLASFETFERYGIDRPDFLTGILFQVDVDNLGSAVVSVSSREPIEDFFVTMLVDATWEGGRFLRGYTVLLDSPAQLPVSEPQLKTLNYGPVQPSETLSSIASQSRPMGVTLNQMMVAIYQENPQSFSGNMNTLHQGAVLRIPQLDSVSSTVASQGANREGVLWRGDGEDALSPQFAELDNIVERAVPAVADNATLSVIAEFEVERERFLSEIESSRLLLEDRDQQLKALQAQLVATQAFWTALDNEFEPALVDEAKQMAEMGSVIVPPAASTSAITPMVQPLLMLRGLSWIFSPIVLIGLGLVTLTGSTMWYLRHREQDADDVTSRWQALGADLDDDGVSSNIVQEKVFNEDGEDVVVDESPYADSITTMEVGTRLDLARAYADMGNAEDARSILDEVLKEGDDDQQAEAKDIIDNL